MSIPEKNSFVHNKQAEMVFNAKRTILLISTIWKYSFLPRFTIKQNECIAQRNNFSFIGLSILILSVCWIYLKSDIFSSSIEKRIALIQICAIYIQSFLVMSLSYWKRNQIASVFTKMLQIQEVLFQFYNDSDQNINNHHIKIFRMILKFVVSKFLTIFLVIITDLTIIIWESHNAYPYVTCFYMGYILNTIFDLILFYTLYFLKESFFYFILSIRQRINNSLIINYSFFTNIKTNYLLLFQLCIETNKTFQWFILFKILTDFLLIVSNIYISSIFYFSFENLIKFLILLISDIFWFANLLGTLYYLTKIVVSEEV